MSAEGSRYNRGGFIEAKPSTPNGLAARCRLRRAEGYADQLTIERSRIRFFFVCRQIRVKVWAISSNFFPSKASYVETHLLLGIEILENQIPSFSDSLSLHRARELFH